MAKKTGQVRFAKQGQQGARQKWVDWDTTTIFLSGTNGEEWQYLTYYNGQVYMCIKSFAKSGYSGNPQGSVANSDGYFAVAEEMFLAYIKYLIINKLNAEAIDVNSLVVNKCVAMNSNNVMIASMNLDGDGAYKTYYENGQVQLEFKPTADNGAIASYDSQGRLNWMIGADARFMTTAIDSWKTIKQCDVTSATNLNTYDESKVKSSAALTGTEYKVYSAVSGSVNSQYSGLTVLGTVLDSAAPGTVTDSQKFTGFLTAPGQPLSVIGDDGLQHMARNVDRYINGERQGRELVIYDYDISEIKPF